jgi:hypothetical protein
MIVVAIRPNEPPRGLGIGFLHTSPLMKRDAYVEHRILTRCLSDVLAGNSLAKTSYCVPGIASHADPCVIPAPHFDQRVRISARDRTLIPEHRETVVSSIPV